MTDPWAILSAVFAALVLVISGMHLGSVFVYRKDFDKRVQELKSERRQLLLIIFDVLVHAKVLTPKQREHIKSEFLD